MKSEKNPAGRRKNRSVLEKYNGSKLGWLHDVIFLVLAVAVIFCIFRFCIGFSLVGGDSMSPTLIDGDIVVFNRMNDDYRPGHIFP